MQNPIMKFRRWRNGGLYPCCTKLENRVGMGEIGDLQFTLCKCGRRHFEAVAEPGSWGISGAPVG